MSASTAAIATPDGRKTPITILTGFAGSGKTTILLNLLPQLRRSNPDYKLAMIKNEIGDLAVDTALASTAELTGSKELLGDCICCTNVGQIEDALETLRAECQPDRVVIETSGSAEPLKLVLEVNRIARSTGLYELDGIISVIDAENWGGYASTSFTAKLQAQQTDLIVVNKWEGLDERAYDVFLDRLGDLDVETPQVKSDRGVVGVELVFGLDERIAKGRGWVHDVKGGLDHHHHGDGKAHGHREEVECISVTLSSSQADAAIDLQALEQLLKSAPKEEIFRIKAILYSAASPSNSDGTAVTERSQANGARGGDDRRRYILNWSFGRWTWSAGDGAHNSDGTNEPALRMSVFTAQYESKKWMKKIENGGFVKLADRVEGEADMEVKRVQ